MFTKLFKDVFTKHHTNIKYIYKEGVNALSPEDLFVAIEKFEQICHQHESAEYNLGLIYLDGAREIVSNYQLSIINYQENIFN